MNEQCHICNSYEIKHYRQRRRDGVWVVTARCENDHIPVKGKPFYPLYLFDVDSLPILPSQEPDIKQEAMFETQKAEIRQIWNPEPVKKYPPMPKPRSTGINYPQPIEEK